MNNDLVATLVGLVSDQDYQQLISKLDLQYTLRQPSRAYFVIE